jgi:peptidoglycan/xylan/chitin deacetylase (PgdA/CDA1 family)
MSSWPKNAVKALVPRSLFISRLTRNETASVLLTFDDGPHPEATPAVLDLLRQFQAKAVFFVVGDRIPRAPALLGRIVDEGHLIGNHTFSHPNDRRMNFREYGRDLRRCQDAIRAHVGIKTRLHRPPQGQITTASIFSPILLGLRTVIWNRSSEDWQFRSDAAAIDRADELAELVQPRDILLFHDERLHTAVALEKLLPRLRERGFHFSPDLAWAQ